MHRQDLEKMTREQLIEQAERLGIARPRVLTQPELIDEIIGRTAKDDRERARARGWLGRARDLLARVVERGLHLPEAARVLRKQGDDRGWRAPPPPLPTVTLAEIYAAQGHLERAIGVLDEVIAREPDHREARAMRHRFVEQAQRSRARVGRERDEADHTAEHEPPRDDDGDGDAPASSAEPPPPAEPTGAAPPSAPRHAPPSPPPPAAAPSPSPAPAADLAAPSTERAPTPTGEAAEAAPAPAVPPLAVPPLPDRYEVDEIVAIAVDPRTIYLYWEVRPTTLAHARARRPSGALCVRVVSVIASWEGPVVDTRDLRVDALYGDRFVRDVQPGSNVRVSVGWLDSGFEPFAVGAEVTAPRAVPVESVAQEVARWEAEPVVAPFQSRRVDAPAALGAPWPARSAEAAATATRRSTAAFADRVFAERVRAASGAHAAPVDTGVATWGALPVDPYEEGRDEEPVEEEAPGWLEAVGSSELGRAGPGRRLRPRRGRLLVPGAVAPGGASELYGGGASELSH